MLRKRLFLGIFMHLAAHFSSLPFPKNESDSEHLPKTLIEDKPFHVELCRAELPIDNKKLAGLVSQEHPSSRGSSARR